MWYSIVAQDAPDSLSQRLQARPEHLARLQLLEAENRLLVAGPNPQFDSADHGQGGFTGSIIIAQFDSFDAAQQWADLDPYKLAGVYQAVQVKPFKPVLPAALNK